MIAAGRTLPDGDRPNLAWYAEPAERFTATGPYDLAVAGDAMHWFDLETPVSSPEGLRTAAGTGTVAYTPVLLHIVVPTRCAERPASCGVLTGS